MSVWDYAVLTVQPGLSSAAGPVVTIVPSVTMSRMFGLPFGASAAEQTDALNARTAARVGTVPRGSGIFVTPSLSPPVDRRGLREYANCRWATSIEFCKP